ncbi:MAG: ABC transporter substrate-binding protein [Saprospiraceae bacterium]
MQFLIAMINLSLFLLLMLILNRILVLIILLIFSCAKDQKKKLSIFHYNQPNIITSLDPAFAKTQNNYWAIDHLYNQLLDLDDSLKIVTELAEKYSISNDGLSYTFQIRKNVFFHDDKCFVNGIGRELNAHDVVYSFNRLMSEELNAPGRWIFLGKLDSIMGFNASDDSTFVLKLNKPFSPLLSLLTMHYCSIVPREAVEYYGNNFREHPVGTGPFKLKKWIERQAMFLTKNMHYYKIGLPLLDGIRISFIEDRNTAYLEFMKKKIDFFSGVQSGFALQLINSDGVLREDRKSLLKMYRGNYLNTEYIGINPESLVDGHPLRNKYFRQALNYSLDKDLMVKSFKYGVGQAANKGFIPAGMSSFDTCNSLGYTYNPDRAKKLLYKMDYFKNYKDSYELVLYTNKDYLDLITFVGRQWQEIGIKLRIELMETASLREGMRNGSLNLFRASWIADYPDEESFLTAFYGANPAPPNYTRFNNEKFNSLYQSAIQESDLAQRQNLYREMDEILIDEAPVIFLMYDQIALFSQNNINGIVPNSINLLKLEKVSKVMN